MLNVYIYTYDGEVHKINKELPSGALVQCVLKEGTSIKNPILLITVSNIDTNNNYLYVSEWGRYYYIDDIIFVSNGIVELHCSQDNLKTYADCIMNCTCRMIRTSAVTANKYLTDELPTTKRAFMDIVETFRPFYVQSEGVYVLINTIRSENPPSILQKNGATLYYMTSEQYTTLKDYMLKHGGFSSTVMMAYESVYVLHNEVVRGGVIRDYSDIDYPQGIVIVEDVSIVQDYTSYTKTFSVEQVYENYLDYSPYTTFEIYLPYYGTIKVESYMLYFGGITINTTCNPYDGSVIYTVSYNGVVKDILSASMKNDVPTTTSNYNEIIRQSEKISETGAVTASIGILTAFAGAAMVATGAGAGLGAGLIVSGVSSAVAGVAQAGVSLATLPDVSYGGVLGGSVTAKLLSPTEIMLIRKKLNTTTVPELVNQNLGTLSGVSGVTISYWGDNVLIKADNVHMGNHSGLTPTQSEFEEICNKLLSGVHT